MRIEMPKTRDVVVGTSAATLTVLAALAFAHFTKVPEGQVPLRDSGFTFAAMGEPFKKPEERTDKSYYCTLAGGEKIYGRFMSVMRGTTQEIIGLTVDAYDAKDKFAFTAQTRIVTPATAAEYKEWQDAGLIGSTADMGAAFITNYARLEGGRVPEAPLAARALQAFLDSEALVAAARINGGDKLITTNQGNLHTMRTQLASGHAIPVLGAKCKAA